MCWGCSKAYDYDDLPFCYDAINHFSGPRPEGRNKVVAGENLVTTPYIILFRVEIVYKALCSHKFTAADLTKLRKTIAGNNSFQVSSRRLNAKDTRKLFSWGFRKASK